MLISDIDDKKYSCCAKNKKVKISKVGFNILRKKNIVLRLLLIIY